MIRAEPARKTPPQEARIRPQWESGCRWISAELRWQTDKEHQSRHLGQVKAHSRAENLAAAWQIAKNTGLVSPDYAA